jgi:hypothetical protein
LDPLNQAEVKAVLSLTEGRFLSQDLSCLLDASQPGGYPETRNSFSRKDPAEESTDLTAFNRPEARRQHWKVIVWMNRLGPNLVVREFSIPRSGESGVRLGTIDEARDADGKRRVHKSERGFFDMVTRQMLPLRNCQTGADICPNFKNSRPESGCGALLKNFSRICGDKIVGALQGEDIQWKVPGTPEQSGPLQASI